MIRRPPRSTRVRSSAASDVYKRQAPTTSSPPRWRSWTAGTPGGSRSITSGRTRPLRSSIWPPSRATTSRTATPTRTRSPTHPCWTPSATAPWSTPLGRHPPQPAIGVDHGAVADGVQQGRIGDRVRVGVAVREVVALLGGQLEDRARLVLPEVVERDPPGVPAVHDLHLGGDEV